jgi:hypothetical protein
MPESEALMSDRITIDQMASAIMDGLTEYADLATDELKKSVKKAGKTVKDEISKTAPKDTGKYQKSWAVKTVKERSNSLDVVVHSRNRYQIAHLLEHGHAKRDGGRVAARSHIAPAEEKGIEELEKEVERALGG